MSHAREVALPPMNCTHCGAANEEGRKFCLECGTRLTVACPVCGTPNTAGARFCGECGSAIAAPDEAEATEASAARAPAPSAEGPTAERRLVSVLFADLVGFTTISESRDAEDVRELLNGYFETSREIIGRYGGTVEKFIGDAVMAVWGTPVAREDDAERAVRAALELVDAVAQLSEQVAVPELALRAGVLTGEAAVTLGASDMGMVAGDMVNTASRLQSVAEPGTVLVGETTQRAASGAIVFEPAGEQTVKGKVAPVPAFRALRVVARRGGAGRAEQLEPPFVGREAELRLLKDFYHATARDHGVRLVSVIGQAGIGKSRLAWEFHKYLDGIAETLYWHQGRSPSYGDGVSFWALGEMVRMRAGIGEGDDEETTRERLASTLGQFVPDEAERARLTGPLLQLLGVTDGQERERSQLFSAWRTFFERLADAHTVVMVFEDLQWADDGLLDFIEEMLSWSRGRPIYMVSLARSELLDRRPTWGAGQRAFTSLGLSPLTDSEMGKVLDGLVPGLPAPVVSAILARAEGIPLYAVETVRTLLNDGRIERDGDVFRPVGDLSELAVPESLHALIAARIDHLPPHERTLIQDASVLGQSFSLDALAAVTADASDLESVLHHLAQRELLIHEDDPRSPERGQFRFLQGLLKEVAYGTLSRRDRRARHLAAARYFETLGDEELSGVLAQHYLDAYRANPEGPEGAAVAAQARIALRAAAQRATSLGAVRNAQRYLEDALETTTDPAEELELRTAAGIAAGNAGRIEAGAEHFRRAEELAEQLGDAGERRRSIARRASFLVEGHQEDAVTILREALAEPGLRPEDPGYIELASRMVLLEMRTGRDPEAVALADRALPAMEAARAEEFILDTLITRGVALANVDRMTEAIVTLGGALTLAERRNNLNSWFRASINMGYVLEPEDPRRAFEIAREAWEQTRRYGVVWPMRYLLGNAADGAVLIGEWDWAQSEARKFLEGELEWRERTYAAAIDIQIRAMRGEDTREQLEENIKLVEASDDPQYAAGRWGIQTVIAFSAGRLEEATHAVDEMLRVGFFGVEGATFGARAATWSGDAAAAQRYRDAYGGARKGRKTTASEVTMDAGIAALSGDAAGARSLYLDALRRWDELGLPFPRALTQLDIVETGAMEPGERRRAAEEARSFFERVGATPFLSRLDAALARTTPPAPGQPARASGAGAAVSERRS